mgnify:CR=1 FL=1
MLNDRAWKAQTPRNDGSERSSRRERPVPRRSPLTLPLSGSCFPPFALESDRVSAFERRSDPRRGRTRPAGFISHLRGREARSDPGSAQGGVGECHRPAEDGPVAAAFRRETENHLSGASPAVPPDCECTRPVLCCPDDPTQRRCPPQDPRPLEQGAAHGPGAPVRHRRPRSRGFRYRLGFVPLADRHEGDQEIDGGGFVFLVDAGSAPHLEGVAIDYVETLQESGFKIDNPICRGPTRSRARCSACWIRTSTPRSRRTAAPWSCMTCAITSPTSSSRGLPGLRDGRGDAAAGDRGAPQGR